MEKKPLKNNIESVFTEYSPRLLGYIRSQVSSHEDAEDILQDVFYQLARTSGDDLSEIERVSSWLYEVARNSILNFWRKKREVSLDTEDTVCEDIAQTLFCSPQDALILFYFGNSYGRSLTSPYLNCLPNNVRFSASPFLTG